MSIWYMIVEKQTPRCLHTAVCPGDRRERSPLARAQVGGGTGTVSVMVSGTGQGHVGTGI